MEKSAEKIYEEVARPGLLSSQRMRKTDRSTKHYSRQNFFPRKEVSNTRVIASKLEGQRLKEMCVTRF